MDVFHNLFLDSEGNVFSVGSNYHGELGLGHNRNQNELNKIPNIPPIKTISCVSSSAYLIDFGGNLWSFGNNGSGQLGRDDRKYKNTPKIVNTLKDIQQISYGCCGYHFIAKNSQNQIFVTGNNDFGQLGKGDTESVSIPKEINSQRYSTIWGNRQHIINQSTMMRWSQEELNNLEMIHSKIKQVKLNLTCNNKTKQEFIQNSFESWNEVYKFLNEKANQFEIALKTKYFTSK